MQLYIFMFLLISFHLVIFGRALLTHVISCFLSVSISIDLGRRSLRLTSLLFPFNFALRRPPDNSYHIQTLETVHTRTQTRAAIIWQFSPFDVSLGHPRKLKNLNRLSPEIENYSFCSFDKNRTVQILWHCHGRWMCMCLFYKHFHIWWLISFHLFFFFNFWNCAHSAHSPKMWQIIEFVLFLGILLLSTLSSYK